MNKTWLIILIIVILLIIFGLTRDSGKPVSGEPIKIGFIGALTGDAAIYGEEDRNATVLAVERVNEAGGVGGRPVEIVFEDGKCAGKDSISAARKLIEVDQVAVILGGTCSGETLAVAPVTEENKILLFSSYSGSPEITNAGEHTFRNAPSDVETGQATADLMMSNGVDKVATITENTDAATAFTDVFKKRFQELGGEILSNELYVPETTDFRSIATKSIALGPSAILVSPQGELGALLIQQLREIGYENELYGNIVAGNSAFIESAGEAAEGLYYVDTAGLSESNPKAVEFLSLYKEQFGQEPSFPYFAGARYDSVFIIAQAIEKVGADSIAIREYLNNLDSYDGVLGNYSFDQNGDIVGVRFTTFQIKNGEAVEI